MNINTVNSVQQAFGSKFNLSTQKKATFNINLVEKLYEIDPSSKTSIIESVKKYADKHGIKEINVALRKGSERVKTNEFGDVLIINCGPKTSTMRFDNTTTSPELSGNILRNIQENYKLMNLNNI